MFSHQTLRYEISAGVEEEAPLHSGCWNNNSDTTIADYNSGSHGAIERAIRDAPACLSVELCDVGNVCGCVLLEVEPISHQIPLLIAGLCRRGAAVYSEHSFIAILHRPTQSTLIGFRL